jgi:transposase InsO family protein
LRNAQPEIFNTDQGAQFTSQAFTSLLEQHGIKVSMDGKGRYPDNLFIERLWRSLKYEEVYLKAYAGGKEARAGIGGYFDFYNEVFINGKKTATPADLVESWKPSLLAEPTETVGPALNSAFLLSN